MDPLAQLDAKVEAARNRLDSALAELAAAEADLAAWRRAMAIDSSNDASAATRQNTFANIARAEERLTAAQREVERAREALADAEAYRDAVAAAMLDAIRRGVSPDEAFSLAEAEVQNALTRQRVVRALIIGGAIVGGAFLLWLAYKAWRKARGK